VPEPLAALQSILSADATISSIVSDRVWLDEVPDPQVSMMPRSSIVLALSGGPNKYEGGYMELSSERVDVFCYGTTATTARALYRAAFNVLHFLTRTTVDDCLVHTAQKDGGPIWMRTDSVVFPGQVPDPTEHWPLIHSSWMVLASTMEVAA
jgi:hypothetical protein